ncbi:hypothetical protein [Saccharicrinis aurantiacus]|uniref:hypothetical protein n=1 Tax=Saccharicrinis aurantiacus TaxID=1849719 RepID=UPI0009500118|nr:hypothetical protein [Saccharicrinis aurantiacus]
MQKLLITSLAVAGGGYLAYLAFKDKFSAATKTFIKENFALRVSGFRVHKLDFKGVDVRVTLDLINLSSLTAKAENIKAEVYYLKNVSPSPLATSSISKPFTIAPKDTTRIPDLRIVAPYQNILYNLSMITDANARFRVVVTATVNGQPFSITKDFSRYESN